MATELLLDRSLKINSYTFRWTGLNLDSNTTTPSMFSKEKIFYVITLIVIYLDQIGSTWWFIDSVKESGESTFTSLTYIAPFILVAFLANSKSVYMACNETVIHKILHILRGLEIKHNEREKIAEKQDIIKKEINFLNFVLKCMNFFCLLLAVSVSFSALILTLTEYFKSKNINLLLPFMIKYPFDVTIIQNWVFAYIGQIFGSLVVVFELSSVDYIFYVCVSFICLQLKLLQYDIRMLFTENRPAMSRDKVESAANTIRRKGSKHVPLDDNTELRDEFARLVNWHQEILKVVKLLEIIYTKSTLFNFISSSILICLNGFNILTIEKKFLMILQVSFLFANLLQIFVFSYFGDMLTTYSMDVSGAIYDSKWYLASLAFRKKLIIMHMRASIPCKMTAYGFADVNLIAFTRIISTSWSYLALLRTVYSSPHS